MAEQRAGGAARIYEVDEWPAAWQTFAAPADIAKGDRGGVSKVHLTAASGNRYLKVRQLNVALNQGSTDYKGLITKVFGKSYDQLFDEYEKNPKINEHC
jgi:hypothetical protein